jgi:hypothetical protein
MTFELQLIKPFVIECAEFGCQAAKCPYEPELRGDAIDDENESDISRELETSLSLTLHLG